MDFSELYKQTGQICRFSPNGAFLAVVVVHRVVIRDSETLEIQNLFTANENLSDVVWSPDSQLIAGVCTKMNYVQAWKLDDPEWTAKVVEGPLLGLSNMIWSPDSRGLITFSQYGLRLTVWSLIDKSSVFIQYPKYSNKALIERHDGKDICGVYETSSWTRAKNFSLETTDAEDLLWSPDDRFIAVWDHPMEVHDLSFFKFISKYKMYIYYPDGRLLGKYSAYDDGLGIKAVKWSPSGQFLAIGSFDQKAVYKQVSHSEQKDSAIMSKWAKIILGQDKVAYELTSTPIQIPTIKPSTEKANPKIGVGLVEFSPCGRWLLSRNDNMPSSLWLFDMQNLRQSSLIIQSTVRDNIRCVKWNPVVSDQFVFLSVKSTELDSDARTSRQCHVYFWRGEEKGLEAIEIPAEWNPDGRSLVLMDKDKFCVAFPLDLEQGDEENGEDILSQYVDQ